MSIVSSTGIGSGIDINSIVTQLVTAEGQPAYNSIQRQKDAANARLSGLGSLKSALSDFQTAVNKLKDGSIFKANQATSSDESIVKITAGAGSVAGPHTVEVKQLATAQQSLTAGFTNSSALVGEGSLTFTAGTGSSFSVNATATTTLQGLRDAINKASGNSFVSASIVNVDSVDGTGATVTVSKLVLSAKNSGVTNGFTVTGTDTGDSLDDKIGRAHV